MIDQSLSFPTIVISFPLYPTCLSLFPMSICVHFSLYLSHCLKKHFSIKCEKFAFLSFSSFIFITLYDEFKFLTMPLLQRSNLHRQEMMKNRKKNFSIFHPLGPQPTPRLWVRGNILKIASVAPNLFTHRISMSYFKSLSCSVWAVGGCGYLKAL